METSTISFPYYFKKPDELKYNEAWLRWVKNGRPSTSQPEEEEAPVSGLIIITYGWGRFSKKREILDAKFIPDEIPYPEWLCQGMVDRAAMNEWDAIKNESV